MGLFGFAKDIGKNLFNRDEDAAKKIKEHIEANNPGVAGLEVKFDDGYVDLCGGECETADAFQKTVLMAGNVKGVVDVFTSGLTIAQAPEPAPVTRAPDEVATPMPSDAVQTEPVSELKVEYYTIERGDTLSKIAKTYYGDAMAYTRIFEANREVIEDPDKIYPGQKIRIPLD